MAQMNFGGVTENVVIRDEFPLEKAREVMKNETIAVIGYGVQGPGQSLNLRDNGFNVIVGQRQGKTYDKAVADGWFGRNSVQHRRSMPESYCYHVLAFGCSRNLCMAYYQTASYCWKSIVFLSRICYYLERSYRCSSSKRYRCYHGRS